MFADAPSHNHHSATPWFAAVSTPVLKGRGPQNVYYDNVQQAIIDGKLLQGALALLPEQGPAVATAVTAGRT